MESIEWNLWTETYVKITQVCRNCRNIYKQFVTSKQDIKTSKYKPIQTVDTRVAIFVCRIWAVRRTGPFSWKQVWPVDMFWCARCAVPARQCEGQSHFISVGRVQRLHLSSVMVHYELTQFWSFLDLRTTTNARVPVWHSCWRASFFAFCLGGRPAIYNI